MTTITTTKITVQALTTIWCLYRPKRKHSQKEERNGKAHKKIAAIVGEQFNFSIK